MAILKSSRPCGTSCGGLGRLSVGRDGPATAGDGYARLSCKGPLATGISESSLGTPFDRLAFQWSSVVCLAFDELTAVGVG